MRKTKGDRSWNPLWNEGVRPARVSEVSHSFTEGTGLRERIGSACNNAQRLS